MSKTINLAEARRKLLELTGQAFAGEAIIISRRGREIAVLIGIEEYRRLKALESQAEFIVTWDHALLDHKTCQGIQFVNPDQFTSLVERTP
jgi:prevent-host-death family protein